MQCGLSCFRIDYPAEEENALSPVVDNQEQERVVGVEEGGLKLTVNAAGLLDSLGRPPVGYPGIYILIARHM